MNKVVITGCTGMIGLALISELLKYDIEILAIIRPTSSKIQMIPKSNKVKVVECDVSNLLSLKNNIAGQYDTFYHLAWDGTFGDNRNNMYLQNKNVQYTIDAVQLAHHLKCTTFIGTGSQAEYGRVSVPANGDSPAFPENGYGIAKLCAGMMSRIECNKLGIHHIWVRIFSVYGPNDNPNTMIITSIMKMLRAEKPYYTKAEQLWDYLYSGDAANALYRIGTHGKNNAVYCLGSGRTQPLADYIQLIRDNVNKDLDFALGEIPYSANQVMFLCADITKLINDTGFLPKISFEDGIKKTIEWCRECIQIENDKYNGTVL